VTINSGVRTRANASGRRTTTVTDEMTVETAQTSQRTAVSVLYSAVFLFLQYFDIVGWAAGKTSGL